MAAGLFEELASLSDYEVLRTSLVFGEKYANKQTNVYFAHPRKECNSSLFFIVPKQNGDMPWYWRLAL